MRFLNVLIGCVILGLSAMPEVPAIAATGANDGIVQRLQHMWPCNANGPPNVERTWHCHSPHGPSDDNKSISYMEYTISGSRTYHFSISINGKPLSISTEYVLASNKAFVFVEGDVITIYYSNHTDINGATNVQKLVVDANSQVTFSKCRVRLRAPFMDILRTNILPLHDDDLTMRYVEHHLFVDGADTIERRLTNCESILPHRPRSD